MPYKTLEERREYHKKYRETHRKEFCAYSKKYYSKPEVKEHYRKYRKEHPFIMKDKWKIAKKKWHDLNKKRRYAKYKEYRKINILRMRARDQRRIALERGAKGILTNTLMQLVYESNIKKFGRLSCYLCFIPLSIKESHLEHKIPLSRGGNNVFDNLDVSCKKCNFSKRNKTEKEYREYALLVSSISN